MSREYHLYYGGQWQKGAAIAKILSPGSGEAVAHCHVGSPAELNAAVERAHAGAREMAELSAHDRAQGLREIVRGIEDSRSDFVEALVAEAGKPVTLARAEVERALHTFRTAIGEAERMGGEALALDLTEKTREAWGMFKRFPLGVVGAITPFNFPLNLAAHKVAPSIASGNACVLKPASQTPGAAALLAGIVAASRLPKGALSAVPCSGQTAEIMAEDDRVKMLTFTGSAEVGWRLKKLAWRKRVTLELGGNAAVIVHHDADLAKAASQLAVSGYAYAGQTCISAQRILVERGVYNEFRELFKDAVAREAVMGDPRDEKTLVGPMISEEAARRVEDWIKEAVSGGARLLMGGQREGSWLKPAMLENVDFRARLWKDEAFGPVTLIQPYGSFEEALRLANDSRYGLQAGVYTRDVGRIRQAFHALEVGGVIVNHPSTFRVDPMPYGGVKDSGAGREGVRHAIEEMTEIRVLAIT
jgi:acyl-CoA reductase-like NAD-dependent aldehyde dehydrogenase